MAAPASDAHTCTEGLSCCRPCAEVWEKRRALNFSVAPVLLHPGYLHGDNKTAKMQAYGAPPLHMMTCKHVLGGANHRDGGSPVKHRSCLVDFSAGRPAFS